MELRGSDRRTRRGGSDSVGLRSRANQACRRARASQGQALRVAAKDAASLDRPCARRLRDLAVGAEECSRRGSNQRMALEEDESPGSDLRSIVLAAVSAGLSFEQIELAWDGTTCWCDGLVVTAYLGEVGGLELQGEFHQGVRDVSGGFVGDGVFR